MPISGMEIGVVALVILLVVICGSGIGDGIGDGVRGKGSEEKRG